MKIRQGFVSNSSSSSFVILLPENFDVEKHIEEKWDKLDSYSIGNIIDEFDDEFEDGMDEDAFAKEKFKLIINKFIEKGYVYQDDIGFYTIGEVLDDYCIASVEVSSDGGSGTLADREQIKKILNI